MLREILYCRNSIAQIPILDFPVNECDHKIAPLGEELESIIALSKFSSPIFSGVWKPILKDSATIVTTH